MSANASYSRRVTRRPAFSLRVVPRKSTDAPAAGSATAASTRAGSIGASTISKRSATAHRREERHLVAVGQLVVRLDVALVDGDADAARRRSPVARGRATPTARRPSFPRAPRAPRPDRVARAARRRTGAARARAQPRTSCTHVPEHGQQQLPHRELDRRASSPAATRRRVRPATPATARDSIAAGADLGEGQRAEQLAESVEALVEQADDGLVGGVARREPGPAVDDHDLDRLGDQLDEARRARSSGSSGRIAYAATRWPSASSSSRMRAPLVSVSGVRVSLTVRMAQRPGEAPRWRDALPSLTSRARGGRAPASTRTASRTAGRRTRASRRRGAPAAGACAPASPAGTWDRRAGSPRASRTRPRAAPGGWGGTAMARDLASATTCGNHRLSPGHCPGPVLGHPHARGSDRQAAAEPGGGRGVPLPRRSATSDHDQLRDAFAHLDARWLVPAVCLSLLLQVFRAWRWQLELRPLARVPFATLWVVTSVAYMAINLLPDPDGRGGAPVAAVAAHRRVSFSNVVGNLIVEKTIDSAVIVFYILLGLLTTREPAGMGAARRHRARRRVRRARARSSCSLWWKGEAVRRAAGWCAGCRSASGPACVGVARALVDGMRVLGRSGAGRWRCSPSRSRSGSFPSSRAG